MTDDLIQEQSPFIKGVLPFHNWTMKNLDKKHGRFLSSSLLLFGISLILICRVIEGNDDYGYEYGKLLNAIWC